MQSAGTHELGYANAAILLGLFDHLLDKGVINRADALAICDDAIKGLADASNQSMNRAAAYLKAAIRPQIAQRAS